VGICWDDVEGIILLEAENGDEDEEYFRWRDKE
jgi:hypothetical protein